MSKFGEIVLQAINSIVPETHASLLTAKQTPLTYQQFFAARAASSFKQFGELNFRGQRVLDIGCGLGANLPHLCELEAASVVALDISVSQAICTQEMFHVHYPGLRKRLLFLAADAAQMPFPDESFDSLVAADTFEHIDNLHGTIQECARVLKPGGHLFAYFPPFYAPWGAHMVNWIHLPWCQVLFSEETILNVARRLEKSGKSRNSQLPLETRLDLGVDDTIPFVSHLTVKRFQQVLADTSALKVVRSELLPPNWRKASAISQSMAFLNRVGGLQEILTAKAVFVIKKLGD